jgi:hypothetical protein
MRRGRSVDYCKEWNEEDGPVCRVASDWVSPFDHLYDDALEFLLLPVPLVQVLRRHGCRSQKCVFHLSPTLVLNYILTSLQPSSYFPSSSPWDS